jgi:hypothetical protein
MLLLAPAVAGALLVALAAILAAPWRDSPLATERALAALGHKPVLHVIVEYTPPRDTVIDLTSGAERREAVRWEHWYDHERDVLRVRLSVGGEVLPGSEYLDSPDGVFTDRWAQRGRARPPHVDPALENFATGYREALDSGEATVVGEEVVDGREAVILRFPLPAGPLGEERFEEVAVDAEGYRPLRFRFTSGATTPWSEASRVVEIETIPRDLRDFEPPVSPPATPRPAGQTGVDERKLEPSEAAAALGRTAVWPGRSVDGVELAEIELMRLTTTWTDGRVTKSHALVFQYGAGRRDAALHGTPSLIITESGSAEETLRFQGSVRPGELHLAALGSTAAGGAETWIGSMQRDGMYLTLESRQRDLILAAAKAMAPLD